MDLITKSVRTASDAIQVQYSHAQHKELAAAVSEERHVVDAINKLAASKEAAYTSVEKWIINESNPIIRQFYVSISNVERLSVEHYKDYALQYENYRRELKSILKQEETIDSLEKKLNQDKKELTKLEKKAISGKKSLREQYKSESEKMRSSVMKTENSLGAAQEALHGYKERRIGDAMRILAKAGETLHWRSLQVTKAKKDISDLFFGTPREDEQADILTEKAEGIKQELEIRLQQSTGPIIYNQQQQRQQESPNTAANASQQMPPVVAVPPTAATPVRPLPQREQLPLPTTPTPTRTGGGGSVYYNLQDNKVTPEIPYPHPADDPGLQLPVDRSWSKSSTKSTTSSGSGGGSSRQHMPLPSLPTDNRKSSDVAAGGGEEPGDVETTTDRTDERQEDKSDATYQNEGMFYDNRDRKKATSLISSSSSRTGSSKSHDLPPYPSTDDGPEDEYLTISDSSILPASVDDPHAKISDTYGPRDTGDDTYLDMSGVHF